MNNKPMPWIKQYPTRLHDVRLASLNDRQQLRYFQLYLLAGQLNADGLFIQDGKELSVAEIAFLLRVNDPKQLEKDLATLKKSKLIRANGHGPFIADFKDEQVNWLEKQREDRERQQRKRLTDASQDGHDNVTRDKPVSHAPRTRTRFKNQIQIKNQTNPLPPSDKKDRATLAGGLDGAKKKVSDLFDGPEFKGITKNDRTELNKCAQVLTLSGLGQSKIVTLLHRVTTRSKPQKRIQLVVAALASVYSDTSVRNKSIVAAHRIDAGTVPAEYFSPAMWENVPENILNVVGDIEQYQTAKKIKPPTAVEALRKRSKERSKENE